MTINKCSFKTTCLDPLISGEITNKKDLNAVILKISTSIRSVEKAAKKNPLAVSLTEEQTKEIQKKIQEINNKKFQEDLKEGVGVLTSLLTKFINQFQKRSEGSDLSQTEKTRQAFSKEKKSTS